MSRVKWIQEMIAKNMTAEEVIATIIKGDETAGIKGMTGTDKEKETFAKLNYKKALKKLTPKI